MKSFKSILEELRVTEEFPPASYKTSDKLVKLEKALKKIGFKAFDGVGSVLFEPMRKYKTDDVEEYEAMYKKAESILKKMKIKNYDIYHENTEDGQIQVETKGNM